MATLDDPVANILAPAPDPTAALAELMPRLAAAVGPHGFIREAAGNDWAHWVRHDDDSVVRRADARVGERGLLSITMTGATMPAEVEREVRRVASPSTS